ncbi:MAG: alanine racemase [Negativicutes bacterium]|nr:alanine racemase [Negativicutes bacterium]
MYPQITVDLRKFSHNVGVACAHCQTAGVTMELELRTGSACSPLAVAALAAGVDNIAVNSLPSLIELQGAGLQASYALLRPPLVGEMEMAVSHADCIYVSQLVTARRIGETALQAGKTKDLILMLDLTGGCAGESEGRVMHLVEDLLNMNGVSLLGLALAARGGDVAGKRAALERLVEIAEHVRVKFWVEMAVLNGGEPAYDVLLDEGSLPAGINRLRVGRQIFTGYDNDHDRPLSEMYTDVFALRTEIVDIDNADPRIVRCATGGLTIDRRQLRVADPAAEVLDVEDDCVKILLPAGGECGDYIEFTTDYRAFLTAVNAQSVEKRYI